MTRPLRIEYDGAIYHITSRGNEHKQIFLDNDDLIIFLDLLEKVNKRYKWLCHAYCLMNNHYHIVIETPNGNLAKGMRQLNGVYTQKFNIRHSRVGHIFQGRYHAVLIEKDPYLLEVCRYVVLNPVRAKIVKHPLNWQWSSFKATVGKTKNHPCLTTEWLLSHFGDNVSRSHWRYNQFIEEGIGAEPIWKNIKAQIIYGGEKFTDTFIDYIKKHKENIEVPRRQRFLNRPTLKDVFLKDIVENKKERNRMIKFAAEEWGYSQKEISDYLGLHYSTLSRLINEEMSKVKT